MLRILSLTILTALAVAGQAQASPVLYTPNNPTFGGNPANAPALMAVATANNHFKDHSGQTPAVSSTQALATQITNSVLADVASKISAQITGGTQSGTYQLGGSIISFVHQGSNIVLTVNDGQGGVTTVTIPDPNV
jgi:curli production assembly/transport component CsgF